MKKFKRTVEIFRVYSYQELDIMVDMLRNLRFVNWEDLRPDTNGEIKAEGVYWISRFKEQINKGYANVQLVTSKFKMWVTKKILQIRGFRFEVIQ